jgi:hypothetical protein
VTVDRPGRNELRPELARAHQEQALDMMRALGSRPGEANAIVGLGVLRRVTGDYPGAARDLEEGLKICREIGDQGHEAETLNQTGILRRLRGGGPEGKPCLDLALQMGEGASRTRPVRANRRPRR